MNIGTVYILLAIVALGANTVFLRLSLTEKRPNQTRLVRAITQTVIIVSAFFLLNTGSSLSISLGLFFPLLNGLLGGLAFISFSRGLQEVDASVAKPIVAVNLVIPVSLGIVVLGESLSIYKVLGVVFSILAVYLLTSGESNQHEPELESNLQSE